MEAGPADQNQERQVHTVVYLEPASMRQESRKLTTCVQY
jgi:hypothetical protein